MNDNTSRDEVLKMNDVTTREDIVMDCMNRAEGLCTNYIREMYQRGEILTKRRVMKRYSGILFRLLDKEGIDCYYEQGDATIDICGDDYPCLAEEIEGIAECLLEDLSAEIE